MDIVANTRTNHWVVLKSKKMFLAFAELNHFRIKRSLFLLTRKFINDLIKKNSCLFAKCGTQTKLFLVMAHKIRCYYGKRFSSLLFCTPIFKICLFVLIFEFPALFVLISWLSSHVENQSESQNSSDNCKQISVCWRFSVIEFHREKKLEKCEIQWTILW